MSKTVGRVHFVSQCKDWCMYLRMYVSTLLSLPTPNPTFPSPPLSLQLGSPQTKKTYEHYAHEVAVLKNEIPLAPAKAKDKVGSTCGVVEHGWLLFACVVQQCVGLLSAWVSIYVPCVFVRTYVRMPL